MFYILVSILLQILKIWWKHAAMSLRLLLILAKFQNNAMLEVILKCYSKKMQLTYKKAPVQKCDFNKVAKQFYWNLTSVWVFFCKFPAYFQNIFLSFVMFLQKSCFFRLCIIYLYFGTLILFVGIIYVLPSQETKWGS